MCSLWPCKEAPAPPPGVRDPSCWGPRGKCWVSSAPSGWGPEGGLCKTWKSCRKLGALILRSNLPMIFFPLCQIFIRQMLSYPAASCRDSGHLLVASWFTRIIIILGTTSHRELRGSEKVFSKFTLSQIHSSPCFLASISYFFPFP